MRNADTTHHASPITHHSPTHARHPTRPSRARSLRRPARTDSILALLDDCALEAPSALLRVLEPPAAPGGADGGPADGHEDEASHQRLLQPSAVAIALHVHALCCVAPPAPPQGIPLSTAAPAVPPPPAPSSVPPALRAQLDEMRSAQRLALAARLAPHLLKQPPLATRGHALLCWALPTAKAPPSQGFRRAAPAGASRDGASSSSSAAAAAAVAPPMVPPPKVAPPAPPPPAVAVALAADLEAEAMESLEDSARALATHMASHPDQAERTAAYRSLERLL